jgi:hypothetical protein
MKGEERMAAGKGAISFGHMEKSGFLLTSMPAK